QQSAGTPREHFDCVEPSVEGAPGVVGGSELFVARVEPVERDPSLGRVIRYEVVVTPQEASITAIPLPTQVARHALTPQAVMVRPLQMMHVAHHLLHVLTTHGKALRGERDQALAVEGDSPIHRLVVPPAPATKGQLEVLDVLVLVAEPTSDQDWRVGD